MRARAFLMLACCGAMGAQAASAADIPGNRSTKAALQKGRTFVTTLGFAHDADWFKLVVDKGATYVLEAEGDPRYVDDVAGRGLIIDSVVIYRANGSKVASAPFGGIVGRGLEFTAPQSGILYAAVSGHLERKPPHPPYTYPARYRVLFDNDCRGTTETLCSYEVGAIQKGKLLYSYDIDVRRVRLRGGVSYTLSLPDDDRTGNRRAAVTVRGQDVGFLGDIYYFDPLSNPLRPTFTAPATRDYFISIDNGYNGFKTDITPYSFRLAPTAR